MSWIRLPSMWAIQVGAHRLARRLAKDGVPRREAKQFARYALEQVNQASATAIRLELAGDLDRAAKVQSNLVARLEAESAALPRDAARAPFDWGKKSLSFLLLVFKVVWFVAAGFFILCFYLAWTVLLFVLALFGFRGHQTVNLSHLDLLFLRGKLG